MKQIPDINSEIGLYRQGWNDAARGDAPRFDSKIIPIEYALGFADAKAPKQEK